MTNAKKRTVNKATPPSDAVSLELEPALIEQYKAALTTIEDMRLTILLAFNAFEEMMRAFAAWRVGCSVKNYPRHMQSAANLIAVVLVDDSPEVQRLRRQANAFKDLRNEVAHQFHRRQYTPALSSFVRDVLSTPLPTSALAKRRILIRAADRLTWEIALHLQHLHPRVELPMPMLQIELVDHVEKS